MDKEKQTKTLELTSAGKDEMNLAEFPFALLSDKGKAVKTLQFSDTITGTGGKLVARRWTITASDKFGMPTRDDEKVYVALMQITKENGCCLQFECNP
jgi:hypothetical protein